jgi:NAD(P)-dependent dehydrogenase (short-subunit alcohol dehydrogenase family)
MSPARCHLQFTGKVAIVTGGSTGMGLAVAQQLAAEGASVIIAGRTQSKLDAAVKGIKEAGGEAHAVVADVGIDADNKRIVETTLDLYGRLDISFVNAGTLAVASFSEVSTTLVYTPLAVYDNRQPVTNAVATLRCTACDADAPCR